MCKALHFTESNFNWFENIKLWNCALEIWEQRLEGFLNTINKMNLFSKPLFNICCVTGTVMGAEKDSNVHKTVWTLPNLVNTGKIPCVWSNNNGKTECHRCELFKKTQNFYILNSDFLNECSISLCTKF